MGFLLDAVPSDEPYLFYYMNFSIETCLTAWVMQAKAVMGHSQQDGELGHQGSQFIVFHCVDQTNLVTSTHFGPLKWLHQSHIPKHHTAKS